MQQQRGSLRFSEGSSPAAHIKMFCWENRELIFQGHLWGNSNNIMSKEWAKQVGNELVLP